MTESMRVPSLTPRDYWIASLLCALALGLYASTLAPTVTWGDPAKLTTYAHDLYLRVWAPNHALHNLVGWLWGHLRFHDYAYGQNLLSAVLAALTVATVYFIALSVTASRLGALLAAGALTVSHTFWWLAVLAESYSLLFLLFAVALLAALRWGESGDERWVYLSAFALGLAVADHALALLFTPALALFCWLEAPEGVRRLRVATGVTAAFLLGTSLLIGVFVYSLRRYTVGELVQQMTAGSLTPYWRDPGKLVRETLRYPLYLAYQFPGAGLVLGIIGAGVLVRTRQRVAALLGAIVLLDVGFSAGYMYQRQFEILVPSYLAFAVAVGAGAARVWELSRGVLGRASARIAAAAALAAALVLVPVVTYYLTPGVLRRAELDPLHARHVPYRDNARYFFLPDKSGYDGARRYGREVLSLLPPNTVILADFTPGAVLRYFQAVERYRPDVLILDVEGGVPVGRRALEAVGEYTGRRPIYLTDYRAYPQFFAVTALSRQYELVARGQVFALGPKRGTP